VLSRIFSSKDACRILLDSYSLRSGPGRREWLRALPTRAISQPIQTEHVSLGVAQPGRNFSHLKRLISQAEVAIEQLCYFFSRARLLDLVQGSQDMLVEMVVRVWNLAHLRSSGLKADLLKGAHFVFGLLLQNKNSGSGGTGRYQLENQSANYLRLMLPVAPAKVYVRSKPFSPSTRISQFSLARDPAIDTRHSPRLSPSACSILAAISRHN